MGNSIFLYKEDGRRFFRRNLAKFIGAAVLVALSAIPAVRNAFAIDSINDYFESKGGPLFAFVRGDGSLFALTLVITVETVALAAFVLLCAYNDFTTPLGFAATAYITYFALFDALVILRYYSLRALPFFLLQLVALAAAVLIFAGYAATVADSGCRYRYGAKELKNLLCSCAPVYLALAVTVAIRVLFVAVGCIFI